MMESIEFYNWNRNLLDEERVDDYFKQRKWEKICNISKYI